MGLDFPKLKYNCKNKRDAFMLLAKWLMRRNSITSTVIVRVSGSDSQSDDNKKITNTDIAFSLAWMKKRMSRKYLLKWMLALIFVVTTVLVFRVKRFQLSRDQGSSSAISQRSRQLSLMFDTPADMPVFRRDKKVTFSDRRAPLLVLYPREGIVRHSDESFTRVGRKFEGDRD